MDKNISKLRWKCRRGMLELDLCLTQYLDHRYLQATLDEQADFDALLSEADPDIWAWLMGTKKPAQPLASIVNKIQIQNNIPIFIE